MYTREYDGEKSLIVLTFSGETVPAARPGMGAWVPRNVARCPIRGFA